MFVRKKKNKSGSVSIQILEKVGRTNKLVQTVGSSKCEDPDFVAFSEVKNYIPKYRDYKDFLI